MRRHPEERNFYSTDDDAAEAFFRQAAKEDGLSYHEWCVKSGVMDRSALAKIFRHEVALKGLPNVVIRQVPSVGGKARRRLSEVRSDSADRNFHADPPFKPVFTSDFHPVPESPVRRRRLSPQADIDAAAE